MAFLSRVGNLLRHNGSKHVASVSSALNLSLFQAIRSCSSSASTKLFVGGLAWGTDDKTLEEAFSQYGQVVDVKIIKDRDTGRSRGFGFVTFTSTEEASSAIQAFDGQDLNGRTIRVNYATEKPRGGGFGGGYGGGGYGGGYGGAGGYGGGYGGQGGNYGGGGYQGGSYSGGGGNYSGDVGYGGDDSVQGGGNQFSGGGGAGYGGYGGGDSVQSGGGGGDVNYSGEKPGFASLLNDDTTGAVGGNYTGEKKPIGFASLLNDDTTGAVGGENHLPAGRDYGGNEDFDEGMDESNRDEDDYANTRS